MNIKNKYFNVLDNGFIGLIDTMGDDESIEQAARVSYQKGTRKTSDITNLIRYLIRHKHLTPLEMVEFKFHVKCPIFVMRQWIRHRTASVNEESGRYSIIKEEFYSPKHEQYGLQSPNNKQGRSEELISEPLYNLFSAGQEFNRKQVSAHYNSMLNAGVSRELARIDLPLSTYTHFFWKCNLRNLLHFLSLRCDLHAQYEIRQYANIMAGFVKELCPIAFSGWYDYDFKAATFTRLDRELLSKLQSTESVGDSFIGSKRYFSLSEEIGLEIGMTKREIEEFHEKTIPQKDTDFTLNFSKSFTFSEKTIDK